MCVHILRAVHKEMVQCSIFIYYSQFLKTYTYTLLYPFPPQIQEWQDIFSLL